ncbi:MAG: amidohydrolase [Bacteroidetes bacterium]|nr:amidohydrolase [Bacteroidota bacterium]MDA0950561.1 amidohydrolase [Bacteroidota bacterium]
MNTKIAVSAFLLFLTLSCTRVEQVDTLLYNASFYTLDSLQPQASVIAIKDQRIVAVGQKSLLDRFEANERIDLEGAFAYPGLIDAHCHFYQLGLNESRLSLIGTQSFEEIVDRIKNFDAQYTPSVLYAWGWDQNDWPIAEFPVNTLLNELFPDRPVVLRRIDGHAYLVNDYALSLAGITVETEVEGGAILKKANRLTGVLIDGPMRLVDESLPEMDRDSQVRALMAAQQIAFENGLTTVNDAGLSRSVIELIDSLQHVGDLKMRVYAMISASKDQLDYYLDRGPIKTPRLNVRSFKVYADGALGSRGAALKAPYSDDHEHYGALVTPLKDMQAIAERLAESDFQMNTHAIGDSANYFVLDLYERILSNPAKARWKIEHAQVVDPADFDRFSNGIIPSVQPTHATSDMYWAEDRLGAERIKGAYAYQTLLQRSKMLALGTDFPVEQVSPLLTFYAAVARQDLSGFPSEGYFAEQALTREQALKGMTAWAAYSNFEEHEKGMLKPGYYADITVLSKDLMSIDLSEIPKVAVKSVFLAGERVKD